MKSVTYKGVVPFACVFALMVLPLTACDDDGGTSDDPDTTTDTGTDTAEDVPVDTVEDVPVDTVEDVPEDTAVDTTPDGPAPGCDTLVSGLNTGFMVDGEPREFYLDLPTDVDTGGPWPVIFNWHGMGDTATNMRNLFVGQVNNATMPFILVTPEDTNVMLSLLTIDWDVAVVTENNKEARLFDEILVCIEERWGLDEDHVHSAGFSMGGFVTDMLGTIRGEELASVVTWSGAYGSNTENLTGPLAGMVSWPEYTTTNTYAQLFGHGGTADIYDMVIQQLHFDQFAENDSAWLAGQGHDSVVCNHELGHNVPTTLSGGEAVVFFADHPRGTSPSPYASSGLPADFPSYCEFRPAD